MDNNQGHWKECFTAHNVKLEDHGYFGLSAITGGVHDVHDIISVSVYSLDAGRPSSGSSSGSGKSSSSSSYTDTPRKQESSLLFNLLMIVIILFVLYVAWVYYQSTKTYSYKRF